MKTEILFSFFFKIGQPDEKKIENRFGILRLLNN